jgi:hypothetical protein
MFLLISKVKIGKSNLETETNCVRHCERYDNQSIKIMCYDSIPFYSEHGKCPVCEYCEFSEVLNAPFELCPHNRQTFCKV